VEASEFVHVERPGRKSDHSAVNSHIGQLSHLVEGLRMAGAQAQRDFDWARTAGGALSILQMAY
jgi:hypothetical protein